MQSLCFCFLTLLGLAASQAPGVPHGGGTCQTDYDCSLGGACTDNHCICDPWFTSSNCSMLNLQRPRFDMQGGTCNDEHFASYFTWGGRAHLGPDGQWHLFASVMCRHNNLNAWTTVSASAHFIAPEVDAPYKWYPGDCDESGVCTPIVIPWSHNTVSAAFHPSTPPSSPSPSYLLAHIGDGVVTPSKWFPCYNESEVGLVSAVEEPVRNDPGGTCYYSTADNLAGPWTRALNNSGVVINNTGAWAELGLVGNPAPLIFANGSVNLYFTGRTCPPPPPGRPMWKNPTCIGVAHAETWDGVYQMYESPLPVTYPESEDPFVFQDPRGNFHLLTNVNTGHQRCLQGVPCGGHAWSSDGWHFSDLFIGAFGPVVTLANGTEYHAAYVERPLVSFGEDGVTPVAFHVGMGRSSYTDSCNWVQLFCTNGTDPNCGPTRFGPPPLAV